MEIKDFHLICLLGFFGLFTTNKLYSDQELEVLEESIIKAIEDNGFDLGNTPISKLNFNPYMEVQGRGVTSGQADIIIRGGSYENSGVSIGGSPIYDAQTGHYLSEIPVSTNMLGGGEVRRGAEQAQFGWNATAGSIAYDWRPIERYGKIGVKTGKGNLFSTELYAGMIPSLQSSAREFRFDLSAYYSHSNGLLTLAGEEIQRYNARLQWIDVQSQTDLFFGYQKKDFSWPNLYAARVPYSIWREEREHLITRLLSFNHRVDLEKDGDYYQLSAYFRTNRDHYEIPDFSYHARHKTRIGGISFDGRVGLVGTEKAKTAIQYRAGFVADNLLSDSLVFGNYHSRSQFYAAAYVEQSMMIQNQEELLFTAGLNYDDSNRDSAAISPLLGIKWLRNKNDSVIKELGVNYSESTQLPSYTALNNAPNGLFAGDRNLKRSRSKNLELRAEAEMDAWNFQSTLFYRQDKRLVDWVYNPLNPVSSRSVRAADIDVWGVEFIGNYKWENFDFNFGYTWMHKVDDSLAAGSESFYAMDFAKHRFLAGVSASLGAGFRLYSLNEVRLQKRNSLRVSTRSPILSNIGLGWRPQKLRHLELTVGIDNLWDTNYETVPLVPGLPRSWSMGITYEW